MAYIPKPRWTQRQVNFLIDNAYVLKDEEIATILGKTLKSVRRRRERLEIKKAMGRGYVKELEIPYGEVKRRREQEKARDGFEPTT
jgi:hypothetical protein